MLVKCSEKFYLIFYIFYIQVKFVGLAFYTFDLKKKKFVSTSHRFLHGLCLTIILLFFGRAVIESYAHIPFLTLKTIGVISSCTYASYFIFMSWLFYSQWSQAHDIINLFNKGLDLIQEILDFSRTSELFTRNSVLLMVSKLSFCYIRLGIHIWFTFVAYPDTLVITLVIWNCVILITNSIEVMSNWMLFMNILCSRMFECLSHDFDQFLSEFSAFNSGLANRQKLQYKMQRACAFSDYLDKYGTIFNRTFKIICEINNRFGVAMVVIISMNYCIALTKLYYLYFIYTWGGLDFSRRISLFAYENFFVIFEMINTFVMLQLFYSTVRYAERIRSNFNRCDDFCLLDQRLEKTVSTCFPIR